MGKIAKVRVRKRGKTYSYAFEAGKSENGKRKIIEHGGYASQESAYDAGMEAFTDWKHGNIGITSDKISVKEFMENWLKNVAPMNVIADTVIKYRFLVESYIDPFFTCSVQDISPADIDVWVRLMVKKNFSKNSIVNIKNLFSHALSYAVYPCELIQSNPVQFIKVPRNVATNKVKRVIISKEKYEELMVKYPFGNRYHMPIVISYHTGMRAGETIGLSDDEIDLEKKEIHVMEQVKYSMGVGIHFGKPKTSTSDRVIKIDDQLVAELRRWKIQQAANEMKLGESYIYIYEDENRVVWQLSKGIEFKYKRRKMVCTDERGRLISRQSFFGALKKVGLNSHSFRHTHATTLVENGAVPKDVAARLGHKDATITQNLYTHDTEKMMQDTVDIFAKTLEK